MYLLPHNINTAFEALFGEDPNKKAEEEEAFASRWRGIDEARFWQALAEGRGADKLLAIFVIGHSGNPAAIAPFLSSPNQKERWASALCLGEINDTYAYPYLETMLIEGLSLDPATWPRTREAHWEMQWYDNNRIVALQLLEPWDAPSLISTMRQAYQRMWDLEQVGHPHLSGYAYQDALMHALGQRGAFGSLTGLNLPLPHLKIAMMQLALGSLRPRTPADAFQALIGDERLQKEVARVLEQRFGLSKEEREDCILNCYEYSIVREAPEQEDEQDAAEDEEEEEELDIFEMEEELGESIVPVLLGQYQGHTAQVKSVSWSPDGTHLASGSDDASVRVWEWTTGKTVTTFSTHTASVNVVAWSPAGRFIASGGSDNMVYVWDALTGEQITAYAGHSAWISAGLAWSPDGKHLASGSWDNSVQIWEAFSGKTLLTYHGHKGIVCSVAWSPDGTCIASGGGYPECLIHIWDAVTGKNLLTYRDHIRDIKKERPLWHIIDRDAEEWARGASSVHSLSWSPDGTYLASAGLRLVMRVWKAATGENVVASDRTCGPLAWSPDGQSLLLDHWGRELEVWQAMTNRRVASYSPLGRAGAEALGWSPNGKYIVAATDKNILVFTLH